MSFHPWNYPIIDKIVKVQDNLRSRISKKNAEAYFHIKNSSKMPLLETKDWVDPKIISPEEDI